MMIYLKNLRNYLMLKMSKFVFMFIFYFYLCYRVVFDKEKYKKPSPYYPIKHDTIVYPTKPNGMKRQEYINSKTMNRNYLEQK